MSMSFYSPSWPLKRGTEDTYEKNKNIEQQINFFLKNLLLTSPGENISDPSYGVGLYSFLFEPSVDSSYSLISSRISSQISSYLPYLNVTEISVEDSVDNVDSGLVRIKIVYNIVEDSEIIIFNLDVDSSTTMGIY